MKGEGSDRKGLLVIPVIVGWCGGEDVFFMAGRHIFCHYKDAAGYFEIGNLSTILFNITLFMYFFLPPPHPKVHLCVVLASVCNCYESVMSLSVIVWRCLMFCWRNPPVVKQSPMHDLVKSD